MTIYFQIFAKFWSYFNRAVSLINQKHEASIYFARQAYAISKEVSLNNVNVDVKNFVTLEQLILQCAKFEVGISFFLSLSLFVLIILEKNRCIFDN